MTFEQSTQQEAISPAPQPAPVSAASPPSGSATLKTWAYSGKALRAQMIFFVVLTVAALALMMVSSWFVLTPCLVVVAVMWLYHAVVYCYRTMTIRYSINDFNLYYEHGLLNRTTDTMEIINIEDMQVTQTLWDRFINGGVGTVKLYNKTDRTHSGEFKMIGLEDPRGVLETIDRVRQERRGKRTMIQV